MEVYPDGAIYGDPLQHGDVVGGRQGVAENQELI